MNLSADPSDDHPRQGAVAVVHQANKFLVIQRAEQVRAGGLFCFPGGGIEQGESSEQAVVREMQEELGVLITPIREVWQNTTSWSVDLVFWLASMPHDPRFIPNPAEVKWVGWMSISEMRAEKRMLSSAIEFLDSVESGQIQI